MKLKFVDYEIENKGYWDYGYKYWLTEHRINEKGKPESIVILTTNELNEVTAKINELSSNNNRIEFEDNQSFEKYRGQFNL